MAATVELSETNGAVGAPVVTDGIANINFGSYDAPNLVPAAHPIIIGQASYGKWLRVHLAALGGSTQIANLKFWKSSGAYVTGENILTNVGGIEGSGWTYAQTAITAYGNKMVKDGGTVTVPYTSDGSSMFTVAFSSTLYYFGLLAVAPGSANVAIGGSLATVLNAPGYSDYIFIGLGTTASTPASSTTPINQKIFTVRYDES